MHKLIRIYYRLFLGLHIASNVDFRGEVPSVKSSLIKFGSNARIRCGKNVTISNSNIQIIGGELEIADGVSINNYSISVTKGCRLYIGKDCILEKGDNWRKPYIILWDNSSANLANNNRVRCDIHCRFGGNFELGEYNCINERTEIRCDEAISIGSYNMISYNCRIWDTNTHSIYKDETRRQMTIVNYPNIGSEKDKPITKEVLIGNDCLLGEECSILKGTNIGNKCIIGVRSVVSGKIVESGSTAFGNPAIIQ